MMVRIALEAPKSAREAEKTAVAETNAHLSSYTAASAGPKFWHRPIGVFRFR
jgi:hypothetical protein